MNLSERAKEARKQADATGHPGDVALADALEAAEAAQAQAQLSELREEPDPDSFPPPPVSVVRVPRGGVEN